MLGEAIIDADVPITGDLLFHEIKSLRFTVEEDEMLIDLKAFLTASHDTVNEAADFTLFVDSGSGLVDLAALSDGLFRKAFTTVADIGELVQFERTLRLDKGEHRVSLQAKVRNAGHTLTIEGATWNGFLTARRHSHPATAPASTNSKVQGIY